MDQQIPAKEIFEGLTKSIKNQVEQYSKEIEKLTKLAKNEEVPKVQESPVKQETHCAGCKNPLTDDNRGIPLRWLVDGHGEFCNGCIDSVFQKEGIQRKQGIPEIPEVPKKPAGLKLVKVAPPEFSEETMHELKDKHGEESAFKIAWAAHNKHKKKGKKKVEKGETPVAKPPSGVPHGSPAKPPSGINPSKPVPQNLQKDDWFNPQVGSKSPIEQVWNQFHSKNPNEVSNAVSTILSPQFHQEAQKFGPAMVAKVQGMAAKVAEKYPLSAQHVAQLKNHPDSYIKGLANNPKFQPKAAPQQPVAQPAPQQAAPVSGKSSIMSSVDELVRRKNAQNKPAKQSVSSRIMDLVRGKSSVTSSVDELIGRKNVQNKQAPVPQQVVPAAKPEVKPAPQQAAPVAQQPTPVTQPSQPTPVPQQSAPVAQSEVKPAPQKSGLMDQFVGEINTQEQKGINLSPAMQNIINKVRQQSSKNAKVQPWQSGAQSEWERPASDLASTKNVNPIQLKNEVKPITPENVVVPPTGKMTKALPAMTARLPKRILPPGPAMNNPDSHASGTQPVKPQSMKGQVNPPSVLPNQTTPSSGPNPAQPPAPKLSGVAKLPRLTPKVLGPKK